MTNVTPNIWSTVTGLSTICSDSSMSDFRSITSKSNVQYVSKAGWKENHVIFDKYWILLLLSKYCFTSLVHMSCSSSLVTNNNQQNFSFSVALFSTTYGRILSHSSSLVTLRISEERWLRHSVHIFNNNATVIKFISTLANHNTGWACLIKLHCRNFTIVCK